MSECETNPVHNGVNYCKTCATCHECLAEQAAEIARLREAARAIISDQTTPDSDGDVMVNGELINALANAVQPVGAGNG
jgi:hypothetical protein